ncbi:hypothetical protein KORDIASMS9_00443 [Kordia sp. SMS9]|uniref:hypothetical protein n=1 Tax=Kordia sp. SMS9 TaxID=2282170 RepID=UPI000E0D4285|nr:hypothetical protein [Kordia sp. SMS9]AXG68250.1 hypothetical protein KORDIASMS9_00443 [Kordia sp. SMS9]
MKKIQSYFLLTLLLVCFSCDNEPYDGEIFIEQPVTVDPTPDPEPDPVDPDPIPGASLQLNDYDYIKTFSSDTGDDLTFTADFTINANNQFLSQQTSISFLGSTTNAVSNVIRDENSRVTQVRTTVDGVLVNRTIVTYNLDKITEITFEDLQDASGDFTFTFTHLNNEITRVREFTAFSTKFTFDETSSKLIKRETMENGTIVKTENISYDANGNLSTVVITGQDANTYNYVYDNNTNPLLISLNDLYLYAILNDEYDDQYEHWQAMMYSPNNVASVTTQQGSSNLDIQYDANDRILTRNGTIFTSVPTVSSDAVITIDETFQYIN